jgi:hypothetical protein
MNFLTYYILNHGVYVTSYNMVGCDQVANNLIAFQQFKKEIFRRSDG